MASSLGGVTTLVTHFPTVAKRSWLGMWRDDAPFYAAGIAFHSLFSIFALLFLISILLGLFGGDPGALRSLTRFAGGLVPARTQDFLNQVLELVRRPVPRSLIPVAIATTLWTASNVVQALIHALSRIYHLEESRPAWRTRLIALGVVAVSAVLLILGFILLVFGEDISTGLSEIERFRIHVVQFVLALKTPISVLIVFAGVQLIYWLAPNFRQRRRVSSPGALVFTVTWVLATIGFNAYLRNVAVYDKIYGPMATVVVMLVWVHLSANLALFGGEVNAAVNRVETDLENEARAGTAAPG
jgi:membrane protein